MKALRTFRVTWELDQKIQATIDNGEDFTALATDLLEEYYRRCPPGQPMPDTPRSRLQAEAGRLDAIEAAAGDVATRQAARSSVHEDNLRIALKARARQDRSREGYKAWVAQNPQAWRQVGEPRRSQILEEVTGFRL